MSSNKSVVCSPLCAVLSLVKLMLGSNTSNNKELKDATGYRDDQVLQKITEERLRLYNISGDVQLSLSIMLFVPINLPIKGLFFDTAYDVFNLNMELVDFRKPKETAKTINDRVELKIYQLRELLMNITGHVQLSITSMLFIPDEEHKINGMFYEKANSAFGASVHLINFQKPEEATQTVNERVKYQTNEEITEIIEPNEIKENTSILITNAIYFYGLWKHPFTSVKKGTFHTPDGDIEVDMMSMDNFVNVTFTDGYQIIKIPYSGYDDVSLVIVYPQDPKNNLDSFLEKTLREPDIWNKIFKEFVSSAIRVSIPKFRTVTKLDLNTIYKKVGLKDIFEVKNNILTEIFDSDPVHVTKGIQAAIFAVDERGTTPYTLPPEVLPTFINQHQMWKTVDRPFLYFVMAHKQQLLAGFYNGL